MGNHHAKRKPPTKYPNNKSNPSTSQVKSPDIKQKALDFPINHGRKPPTPAKNELIPDNFAKYKEKLKKTPEIDTDFFSEELSNSLDFINKFLLFKYTATNVNEFFI